MNLAIFHGDNGDENVFESLGHHDSDEDSNEDQEIDENDFESLGHHDSDEDSNEDQEY